jgi:peptide subunit release factor 1 (eRF1)
MPAVNDISPSTLRRLSGLRTEGERILSVYLDLDPSEFATADARATQITSLLDEARRQVEAGDRPHAELMGLRADLERLEQFLRDEKGYASRARALAAFASQPLELFETLRLPSSTTPTVVIASAPHIAPLPQADGGVELCVVLVDKKTARIMRGSLWTLAEVVSFGDDVHGHHKAGGWSQARYQRSVAKDAEDHFRHVAGVLVKAFREQSFDRLLVAAPPADWTRFEQELPHDLRERILGRRLSIQVSAAGVDDVNRATAELIADERHEHERKVLGRLHAALASNGHGASGITDTLRVLAEQRVEILIYDPGLHHSGAECPQCGWLSEGQGKCPLDTTEMTPREKIVDVAVARAIAQGAEVLAMREQPELDRLGSIAAVLRF